MIKFTQICIFCILSLSIFSCDPAPSGNDQNGNIDSTQYLPNTFMSNKVGSWWTYGSTGDTTTHNYTRYATGKDTVVNSLPMGFYDRKDLVTGYFTPEYFGTYDSKLVTMIDVDGSEQNYLPYVFYIRNAVVGQNWYNEGQLYYLGIKATVKVNSTLIDENLSMSWGGHTYDSVYHVKSELLVGSTNAHAGTLEVWFNDGLGIIKGIADIDILNTYSRYYVDSLIDYHIEP